MSHILLNNKYNKDISSFIHLRLPLLIKRIIFLIYYRGAPPGKSGVKKENKISDFETAVVYMNFCGLFILKICKKLSQNYKACKQMS